MSLKYIDKNGASHVVSGLTPGGDLSFGAVTTRSGTTGNVNCASGYTAIPITFAEPLPDRDFLVEIELTALNADANLYILPIDGTSKTANGFTIGVYNAKSSASTVGLSWKAFKLYDVADAEALYSDVTDIKSYIPSNASSSNKLSTANDLRTETRSLDRRIDDLEDVVPSDAGISNKLVTQDDLSGVEIDKVEDINDVELTSIQDGQTLIWDATNSKWVNGQGGKTYSAGDGINISNTDEISAKVDDTSITTDSNDALKVADTYKTIFVGTRAQWDALSTADKVKYNEAHITDDVIGGEVADEVTDGDMRPVTSNAVYDGLATKVSKSDVVDNLTSTSTTAPLSAAQGKKLNEKFTYRQFSDTTEYTLTGSSSGRTPQLVWTISNLAVTKGIYLVDCYVQSLSGLGGPVNFYIGTLNPTVGTNNGIPYLYHTIYAGAAYSVMRDIKTIPIDSDQTISIYVGIDIMANSSCKVTNKWLTFTKIADATS